jgi:hypothetical protein
MIARLKRICAQAGVAEDAVEDLVRLVIKPPEGTINVTDLAGANDVQVALQAATVAATNTRQFGQALQALLAFVDVRQVALSDYDSGRFWHLKGVAV